MTPSDRAHRFQRALDQLDAEREPPPICNMLQAVALYIAGLVAITSPLWMRWIWGS